MTLAEHIPHCCTVDDVCRILQINRGTFYKRLETHAFPFAEIQPRIGHPRFSGADIQLYLEGHFSASRVTSR